ncbi:MAG: DUF2621 family protein [Candidatus Omnitrophota bacterium]
MLWDKQAEQQFKQLIGKMPLVLRGIAEKKVSEKAESLALAANRTEIGEKEMVDAFFAETPFGFQGLMKNDLKELGIDYMKYGYDK